MGAFAGWELPLQYSGALKEHAAVRAASGLFDISHLGRVEVMGPLASRLVSAAFTVDAGSLSPGTGAYALSLTTDGGIADDLVVLAGHEGDFLILPNASNTASAVERLTALSRAQVSSSEPGASETYVSEITAETAMLALQGPSAYQVMDALGADVPVRSPRYTHNPSRVGDIDFTWIRSGYTGEQGVEIICDAGDAPALWRMLMGCGAPMGLVPAGLIARDLLRLEMGYPLHGADIDAETRPHSAGLMWAISHAQPGCIGLESAQRAASASLQAGSPEGSARYLVPLLLDSGIPRAGSAVIYSGEVVGEVTSGGYSPSLERGISLCRLPLELTTTGTRLEVEVRAVNHPAEVAALPFVRSGSTD